ncbi:MAG: hypothetical protein KFH98_01590 [Gemmatimonadetes bacterium]|nr:hypothetical protein [Gemmatimonadota bacterium]
MTPGGPIDDLLAAFADPAQRPASAAVFARRLGADDLIMFAPDPELGVLLPAPGFRQTIRHAAAWRKFLDACTRSGGYTGELPIDDGSLKPVRGMAAPGCVAIIIGAGSREIDLSALHPALTLLGALFRQERVTAAAEVRASADRSAAERADTLARTVQAMHTQLAAALAEAEAARALARERTDEAEALVDELGVQAGHLQEQAAELETLNEDLAQRTSEAESARRAAETADRAKSEFLASMSHELRTPINAIIGYAELLDMGISGGLNEEQLHHVRRVRASSRHLLTLINDVLDLAKIEAGHMTVEHHKSNIRGAVADAVSLLALQAEEKGLSLTNECGRTDISYVGDVDRVRQILANLLSNAVKFTGDGGRISVRCGSAEQAPGTAVDGSGPWTIVEVEDTGIGMSAEEAVEVFQPFVQAAAGRTRAHGGTGLGLTISRQLARLMGGDLTVRTEQGAGSCLTLWLPATEARPGTLDESIRVGAN